LAFERFHFERGRRLTSKVGLGGHRADKVQLFYFLRAWRRSKGMPALEKIALEFKNSDLLILGVDSGESGILESYQVTAYPAFILIERDGNIVANEIGFRGEDQLRQLIDKAGLVPQKQSRPLPGFSARGSKGQCDLACY
jgi:hypothetical protein